MDLNWLPVKFRIEFKILLIVFTIFRGLAPLYLSFLIICKPVSKYNLRSSNDSTLLSYPNIKPKATLCERAFVFTAPGKLWNALPRLIRESTSIDTFKRKLKTHLFEKAFLANRLFLNFSHKFFILYYHHFIIIIIVIIIIVIIILGWHI